MKDKHELFQQNRYKNYNSFDEDKYYLFKIVSIMKKNKIKKGKLLDIGCADGSYINYLKNKFEFDVYGIDVSADAIKKSQKKGLKTKRVNVENGIPFENNSFDIVTCSEVIEHVYDTDFLIQEISRILKPNGTLIITTPNLVSLTNRILILLGKYPLFVPEYKKDQSGHIRAYTVDVMINQLKDHKFKPYIITSPNFPFPVTFKWIPRWIKYIFIKFGDFFPKLGCMMIIFSKNKK